MNIYIRGNLITSYDDWKRHFINTLKKAKHWKVGRSAESTANYWIGETQQEVINVLSRIEELKIHDFNDGHVEHITAFDNANNGREHDLCFPNVTSIEENEYTLCIEAKVDENFDQTNREYELKAKKEVRKNPNSKALKRLKAIYNSFTGESFDEESEIKEEFLDLRYQLFTGLAGTIAEMNFKNNDSGVFLIHVFKTNLYDEQGGRANRNDLINFLRFLGTEIEDIQSGNIIELDLNIAQNQILKCNYELGDDKQVYIAYLETEL